VTVHPYRAASPETFLSDSSQLRQLVAEYTPIGRDVKLVQGEWGWSYSRRKGMKWQQGTQISAGYGRYPGCPHVPHLYCQQGQSFHLVRLEVISC
jgi:hypothetical protein